MSIHVHLHTHANTHTQTHTPQTYLKKNVSLQSISQIKRAYLFFFNLTQAKVIWEDWTSAEKTITRLDSGQACGAYSWLIFDVHGLGTGDNVIPCLVVLNGIIKNSRTSHEKQTSMHPFTASSCAPASRFLPWISALTSFSDELWPEPENWNKLFPPQVAFGHVV